jgi:aspartyl-tRNA(Asn)/glutamyl-tRNA(Gln) amidotransferase subunit C
MPGAVIEHDKVKQVARLARLSLDEAQLERMTRELGAILEYVALLDELDTSAIEPTSQIVSEERSLRADDARAGLDREIVLGQSPSSSNDGFAVPAFVDE